MKVKVCGYGTLEGKAIVIVSVLQQSDFAPISDMQQYMQSVKGNVKRFTGEELRFAGETEDKQAEEFLKALEQAGLLEIERE